MLLNLSICWSHLDGNCFIIMVVYNMSYFHSLVDSLLGPFCPQTVVCDGGSLPRICGNTGSHGKSVLQTHLALDWQ